MCVCVCKCVHVCVHVDSVSSFALVHLCLSVYVYVLLIVIILLYGRATKWKTFGAGFLIKVSISTILYWGTDLHALYILCSPEHFVTIC